MANTASTLTVEPNWQVEPDATSYFVVSENTWKFAGLGSASPVEFEVPNRPGATVHISGLAANSRDEECSRALSPVTRWQLTGGANPADEDAPPKPTFGLAGVGHGSVELRGIGFPTLANTHSISAGILNLFFWKELESPSTTTLASAMDSVQTSITLSTVAGVQIGTLIQVEAEIVEVEELLSGTQVRVARGSYASAADIHAASTFVYPLTRHTVIAAFVTRQVF